MFWLEDKEKDGEMFTNSECFTYCLKCFVWESRVELWTKVCGYKKTFDNKSEALFTYRVIKGLSYFEIERYLKENYFEKK